MEGILVEIYLGIPGGSGRGDVGRHHAEHNLIDVDVPVEHAWGTFRGEVGGGHVGFHRVCCIKALDREPVTPRIISLVLADLGSRCWFGSHAAATCVLFICLYIGRRFVSLGRPLISIAVVMLLLLV